MNTLYVVGLGPGKEEFLTGQARKALEQSQVLCGYTVYVDLVAPLFPEKETYSEIPALGQLYNRPGEQAEGRPFIRWRQTSDCNQKGNSQTPRQAESRFFSPLFSGVEI